MAKPETRFRLRVERNLPDTVYHLKIALAYNAGVADSWYSMHGGQDLWVEYKWIQKFPVRVPLDLTGGKNPLLSKLQQNWLFSRHAEGRNVAVVAGSVAGALVFSGITWMKPLAPKNYELNNPKETAMWLIEKMEAR